MKIVQRPTPSQRLDAFYVIVRLRHFTKNGKRFFRDAPIYGPLGVRPVRSGKVLTAECFTATRGRIIIEARAYTCYRHLAFWGCTIKCGEPRRLSCFVEWVAWKGSPAEKSLARYFPPLTSVNAYGIKLGSENNFTSRVLEPERI